MKHLGRHLLLGLLLSSAGCLFPGQVQAQIAWQDLVFTGGLSAEGYRGNQATVAISAVDSTEKVTAAVGEFGVRGELFLFNHQKRSLNLQFDAGLRQFVAFGFKVRDYAPREWVGRADLSYRESLGSVGNLWIQGGMSGRKVEDRPPMPLFLQPGYTTVDGQLRFQFFPIHGTYLDARFLGEKAEYATNALTPQLGLLDRQVIGVEAGLAWGSDGTVRLHTGYRASEYRNQGTFDPRDPFRRDRTLSVGATWTVRSPFFAQIGIEGTRNRSNSSRPEYDALSVRSVISAPLPYELSLNFLANITAKRYLTKTEYARLVPGEEADNASVVYLELARPLMVNLDGAVRFGWNRAETDIGNSYFERYRTSFLLRYRPWER